MAVPLTATLRDEKRALLERTLSLRTSISELNSLLEEIDRKFLPEVIYRTTLAVPYWVSAGGGRQYVEYRVWVHSNERGKYPMEVMSYWYFELLDLFPPANPELLSILSDLSSAGFEEDEEIDPDEIEPPDAEMDRVYGAATYTPWLYLAEQRGEHLVKRGGTVIDPEAVSALLGKFGVRLSENVLRGRRRHRGRRR